MIDNQEGIKCNWWRNVSQITQPGIAAKLTAANLDRHRHDYELFKNDTPFISLTAGSVERDVALRLNRIHEARDVALRFATNWGEVPGYLFYCWVIVGLKPAVGIASLAEEVRELNTYLSWSDYQLEGEITAKIVVTSNHIKRCERWEPYSSNWMAGRFDWEHENKKFEAPSVVANIRDYL